MVDLHCHVIPGVDDGARTIEESLDMLNLAAGCGTTDLVATPHASLKYPFDANRINEAFRDLSKRTTNINLHVGCDLYLDMPNVEDALVNPSKYTINNGSYLMIELPEFLGLSAIRHQLRALIYARIRPIITHPERNTVLQSAVDHLKIWIRDGCLVQVTAQSFFGRFGRRAQCSVEALMDARLVHFVASDAHDCMTRSPDLSAAYAYVGARWGKPRAQALFTNNPGAVISGTRLPLDRQGLVWRRVFLPCSDAKRLR